jgi:hypothetical protein
MPFVRPYRCSACNWRGMMGRISFDRHRKVNITINALIYLAFVAAVIFVAAAIREKIHPTL